ncbi:MAG: T9SS type A sorting domain-containing protein [Bacteroidota bacterium]
MKKSYLLILGLGISIVSFGQKKTAEKKPAYKGLCVDVTTVKGKAPHVNKAAGDIFFEQHFNGSIADWTTSGQDAAIWLFDTNGPDGQFANTDNSDIITSTTAGNGFMIFDADAADPSAPYVDKQGSLVSPVVDLTGRPSVSIRFQHAYRTCCTAAFFPKLEVTTDGFATVTTYDVTATGIGVNDFSGTVVKEVNIDAFLATAADITQFQFRFNFDGVSNSSSHYYWQIDDIEMFEPHQYSLEAVLPYWGSIGYWEVTLPYSMVPQDQIAPINYSYLVENKGSVSQTDVVLETTIPEASFTNTGTMETIPAFSIDTAKASAAFTPDGSLTTYNPSFVVTSSNTDIDPSDNTGTAPAVQITQGVYARDMITVDGGSYNQGEGFEVGNIFDIYADNVTGSASFWVRSTSNTGASVYVRLYSIDAGTGDFIFVTESDAHTVTEDEKGTLLTLMFQDAVSLTANNSYLVVAGSYGDGGTTDDLIVGTSGTSEEQTTFYFDMTDQTWYYTTNTPIVRMNLGVTPTIASTDPDNTLCAGQTATLTSDVATGNVWSTGETTQSIVVSTSGTYYVTANGLPSQSITITVNPALNTTTSTFGGTVTANLSGAAYQWVDCNNGNAAVAGASAQTFAPSVNGSYAVIITSGGCADTSNCVAINNAALNELQAANGLSVFPNPAKDKISVDFNLANETTVTIQLTDLAGKVISSKTLGSKAAGAHSVVLETAAVSNGIYVLNLVTNGETSSHKVVISH